MKIINRISEEISLLIDKLNILSLIIILITVISVCAFSYHSLSFHKQGIINTGDANEIIELGDAFYYSIVTITTLGYGDYKPMGWSKIISVIEVLFGVTLIALIVAKISSERQIRLIKLIYSSDHERRLKEFNRDINNYIVRVRSALENHDQDNLNLVVKNILKFIESLKAYFIFQSKYGILLDFGNKGTIRKIVKRISKLAEVCSLAAKLPDTNPKNIQNLEGVLLRIGKYSDIIKNNYDDEITRSIISHTLHVINAYHNYIRKRKNYPEKYIYSQISVVTDVLLKKVEAEIPKGNWDKGLHKIIAKKIGISNNLAHKCITKLLDDKRISKP